MVVVRQGIACSANVIEIGSLEVKLRDGFQEMNPAFVMFVTGRSSALFPPTWCRRDERVTDRQLPEAMRWLTRRVHLQPMAIELPVEVRQATLPPLYL
jgi:hypothetical protein